MVMTTPAQFQNAMFTNEDAARQALELVRWPDGPVCPHCGTIGDRIAKVEGTKRSHRSGLFYCNECKGQFTVTVGTVFERSKIPLTKWWMAVYLLNSSKKGFSAHQLHRTLKVTYKTAWFMMHRIREAMRTGGLEPMGGAGVIVEADETYFGTIPKAEIMPRNPNKKPVGRRAGARRPAHRAVFALVERGGKARTFHVAQADQNTISKIMRENVAKETRIDTDESKIYNIVPWRFAEHETIKHSADEYARYPEGKPTVTTNSVEGYFSIFKRGMKGIYQHCSEKHLHRYLAEFDFRYSNRVKLGVNDGERAVLAMKGIEGKRLTYRPTDSEQNAPANQG
jgi:transposase-like protein